MADTLNGVRILDLTRVLSGPYGTMLLADMGAEVIKIEPQDGGDSTRSLGPPFVEGESAYFLSLNRNKRSIAIDLRTDEGRDLFLSLVERTDVVVDNFRPGVGTRLGIDPAACRSRRADIITCSISGFGADGPYADRPAFDLILQALSGGMSITGMPGQPPVRAGIPIGDLAGGMFAALSICGALAHRAFTGHGQHIDLSLLDVQVSLLTYVAQNHFADKRVPVPIGSGHQTAVPYGAFPTKDGHLVVAILGDTFWEPFCRAIERLELGGPYATQAARTEARDLLVPIIEERLRTETTAFWLTRMERCGVPAAPVLTVDQVVADPQVCHRSMVTELSRPHPVAGHMPILGNPVKVGSADRFEPPPLLGEHTDEVLEQLLGLGSADIALLRARKVVS